MRAIAVLPLMLAVTMLSARAEEPMDGGAVISV